MIHAALETVFDDMTVDETLVELELVLFIRCHVASQMKHVDAMLLASARVVIIVVHRLVLVGTLGLVVTHLATAPYSHSSTSMK